MNSVLYIVLAVVGFFVVLQLYIRLSTFSKKGKVIEEVPGVLGSEISSGKKLLIYFYTTSCAACKRMTPVIDKLNKEFENIRKVNLAEDMAVGKIFGVMGTPSTVIVEGGEVESFLLGAKTEAALRKLLG